LKSRRIVSKTPAALTKKTKMSTDPIIIIITDLLIAFRF
jgi:hypothetical protein